MQKAVFFLTLLFVMSSIQAQKWSLRGGVNVIRSYGKVTITDMQISNGEGRVDITPGTLTLKRLSKRSYFIPSTSFFVDISLIRTFNRKSSISIGYLNLYPLVGSSVVKYKNEATTTAGGFSQDISVPALRFNYIHTLLQTEKINPSSLSVSAGLLLTFRGRDASFSSSNIWGGISGAPDSSGNTVNYDYVIISKQKEWRPKPPTPYLNIGFDGGLRLGKRFKVGGQITAYIGYTSLYKESNTGITKGGSFAYDLALKPYFFSGGIYLQYRIK